MTRNEAISILNDELKHCREHLKWPDKAPAYYKEMGDYCDALETAIKALKEPEITEQQLREYCHKRCLTIITNDMFEHLTRKEKTDER